MTLGELSRIGFAGTLVGPPTQLVINGELKNKPSDLADGMNDFFVTKVQNLRKDIPPCRNNPYDRVSQLMSNRNCSFRLQCVHPDVISEIIRNVKSSKTCGLDNIDSHVLKLVSEKITPVISHIVNLSIEKKCFPSL